MRLLLDTCTFLWYVMASDRLSPTAKEAMLNPANELFLSAASVWEIAVKYSTGRLMLTEPPEVFVPTYRQMGHIASLDLREETALYAARLPRHHNDPFDRMLICQSIVHDLIILSPDLQLARYPVRMLW